MKLSTSYRIIASFILISLIMTGCSNDELNSHPRDGLYGIGFSERANFSTESPFDTVYIDYKEQTVLLPIVKLAEGVPMPHYLNLSIDVWDNAKQDWVVDYYIPSTHMPDEFSYVTTIEIEGKPTIKVDFTQNETNQCRKIRIKATSDVFLNKYTIPYGIVCLCQEPAPENIPASKIWAVYKGQTYTSEVFVNEEGEVSYSDPGYSRLMEIVDAEPSIHMVMIGDDTVYYYDSEDIADNRPYRDMLSLPEQGDEKTFSLTRATGFEEMSDEDLGFYGVFEHDYFNGSKMYKGLTNFHYTWNITNLKPYGMNDKITSIALAYRGEDDSVCSVLTVWDDADYNHGDDDRSKHRISIYATKKSPLTKVANLKNVKKIGVNKTWNDCISCMSFHFGYIDRLLLDY